MQEDNSVTLLVYDISNGMASRFRRLTNIFFGINHEGVYHTSIVVFSHEFFFSGGICYSKPETTEFGKPIKRIPYGRTKNSPDKLHKFLTRIFHIFTSENYDVFNHNCNHFTNKLMNFLVFKHIPDEYLKQGPSLGKTPLGVIFQTFNSFQKTYIAKSDNDDNNLGKIEPKNEDNCEMSNVKSHQNDKSLDEQTPSSQIIVTFLENDEEFQNLRIFYDFTVITFFDKNCKNWPNALKFLNAKAENHSSIFFCCADKEKFSLQLKANKISEFPTVIFFKGFVEERRMKKFDEEKLNKILKSFTTDNKQEEKHRSNFDYSNT